MNRPKSLPPNWRVSTLPERKKLTTELSGSELKSPVRMVGIWCWCCWWLWLCDEWCCSAMAVALSSSNFDVRIAVWSILASGNAGSAKRCVVASWTQRLVRLFSNSATRARLWKRLKRMAVSRAIDGRFSLQSSSSTWLKRRTWSSNNLNRLFF